MFFFSKVIIITTSYNDVSFELKKRKAMYMIRTRGPKATIAHPRASKTRHQNILNIGILIIEIKHLIILSSKRAIVYFRAE